MITFPLMLSVDVYQEGGGTDIRSGQVSPRGQMNLSKHCIPHLHLPTAFCHDQKLTQN